LRLNNKGYSLLELFAVIFIASAIIFPMVTTLVNNLEINDKLHNRRSAVAISQGTAEGFNRLNFLKIEELVTASNSSGTYYVEFDSTNCDQLANTRDEALCAKLFGATFSNLSLTDETFKVFITDYNLTTTKYNSLTNPSNSLPQKIRTEIGRKATTNEVNPNLYSIYIWIRYDNDQYTGDTVFGGVLSDE